MMKSVGVFVALWGMVASLTANAQFARRLRDSMMMREGEAFIARMPEGLQARQEKAVRIAIAGNGVLLEEVRASRNTVETLPDEVVATDIQGKYRLYVPALSSSKKLPLLIYLHGGGWCFGSINSCARFCMELVREAGVAVLAVEYPLAPEHPYPAALTCCSEAVAFGFHQAEAYGIDAENISIGGD
ncbi:MAG: alpha/beta hydrolase, partial [Odoribacter sp.]|nr:alpha/beta hydrolase [Odoribacter sp.]